MVRREVKAACAARGAAGGARAYNRAQTSPTGAEALLRRRVTWGGGECMSTLSAPRGPTREEIASAYGKTIPDVIGPGLQVLFCGINPSLYSAAVGHHFARPGNRFWPTLHAAGFTERLLSP